jgi:hypothetical protein
VKISILCLKNEKSLCQVDMDGVWVLREGLLLTSP